MSDLISREALKKALHNFFDGKVIDEPAYILRDVFCYIESAPTVEIPTELCKGCRFLKDCETCEEKLRPQGECDNCKHFKESLCDNSPYGWCSIRRVTQEGDLETQVPKDYYCSWFEKGGAE